MKKLLTFLLIGTMFGCGVINLDKTAEKDCTTKKECCKKDKTAEDIKTSQTFKPKFDVDGATCGASPTVNANSVQFGTADSDGAGRVVSQQGYKSITQIRAKADFSHLTSNFVVSTFYMVNNPTNPSLQPKGGDYCDAGGNNPQWNCQEVDFFETNKNVVLSDEHCKYQWLSFEKAKEKLAWEGQKKGINEVYKMLNSDDERIKWSRII